MDVAHIARRPGKKGNFIDGCVKRNAIGIAIDKARQGRAVSRKSIYEDRRKNIQVIRIAVMEKIPDHVEAPAQGRVHEGLHRAEVAVAALVHQRPADGLAHRVDAHLPQAVIVGFDVQVVPGRRDLVDPLAVHVVARGALEARQVEAAKHPCLLHAACVAGVASKPTALLPPATSSR